MDKNVHSDCHLRGDLKEVLPLLTKALESSKHDEWKAEINSWKRPFVQNQIDEYVNPQSLIECVDENTPDDTIVVTDVGQHQLWLLSFINSVSRALFSQAAASAQWAILWAPQWALLSDARRRE